MKDLTFNQWQAHIAKQLELDRKKLYLIPKKQKHEIKLQTVSPR